MPTKSLLEAVGELKSLLKCMEGENAHKPGPCPEPGHAETHQTTADQFSEPPHIGRIKPKETIVFPQPIIGPSGAKLLSYEWKYESFEEFNENTGETEERRISNWEEAERNLETGRNVVHHFLVETPDGGKRVVSLESALKLLGYAGKEGAKVRGVASSVKTLAKLRMELQINQAKKDTYDAAITAAKEQVEKLKPPAEITRTPTMDGRGVWWHMGDARVMQPNGASETTIPPERLRTLTEVWQRNRIAELVPEDIRKLNESGMLGARIADLGKRIAKAEKKVEDVAEAAANESGGKKSFHRLAALLSSLPPDLAAQARSHAAQHFATLAASHGQERALHILSAGLESVSMPADVTKAAPLMGAAELYLQLRDGEDKGVALVTLWLAGDDVDAASLAAHFADKPLARVYCSPERKALAAAIVRGQPGAVVVPTGALVKCMEGENAHKPGPCPGPGHASGGDEKPNSTKQEVHVSDRLGFSEKTRKIISDTLTQLASKYGVPADEIAVVSHTHAGTGNRGLTLRGIRRSATKEEAMAARERGERVYPLDRGGKNWVIVGKGDTISFKDTLEKSKQGDVVKTQFDPVEQTVIHEFGHVLQHRAGMTDEESHRKLTPEEMALAKTISRFATTNYAEFLAEMFVAHEAGKGDYANLLPGVSGKTLTKANRRVSPDRVLSFLQAALEEAGEAGTLILAPPEVLRVGKAWLEAGQPEIGSALPRGGRVVKGAVLCVEGRGQTWQVKTQTVASRPNHLDRQGGELPVVDRTSLERADFITYPEDVQGSNCSNCIHNPEGVCQFHGEVAGQEVDLRGQPVNERNCCSGWDARGTLRMWRDRAKAAQPVRKSADASGDADSDPVATAELIADVLGGLLGEDALAAFEESQAEEEGKPQGKAFLKAWDSLKHPRGPNGRFIPKGSAEAVASAKAGIDEIRKLGDAARTPEHAKKLADHLSILTVKQLHELKKEYGLKASGRLREELVAKLLDRLPGAQERIDAERKGAAKQLGLPEEATMRDIVEHVAVEAGYPEHFLTKEELQEKLDELGVSVPVQRGEAVRAAFEVLREGVREKETEKMPETALEAGQAAERAASAARQASERGDKAEASRLLEQTGRLVEAWRAQSDKERLRPTPVEELPPADKHFTDMSEAEARARLVEIGRALDSSETQEALKKPNPHNPVTKQPESPSQVALERHGQVIAAADRARQEQSDLRHRLQFLERETAQRRRRAEEDSLNPKTMEEQAPKLTHAKIKDALAINGSMEFPTGHRIALEGDGDKVVAVLISPDGTRQIGKPHNSSHDAASEAAKMAMRAVNGFTGTDSLGRRWEDGKLVAKPQEEKKPATSAKPTTTVADLDRQIRDLESVLLEMPRASVAEAEMRRRLDGLKNERDRLAGNSGEKPESPVDNTPKGSDNTSGGGEKPKPEEPKMDAAQEPLKRKPDESAVDFLRRFADNPAAAQNWADVAPTINRMRDDPDQIAQAEELFGLDASQRDPYYPTTHIFRAAKQRYDEATAERGREERASKARDLIQQIATTDQPGKLMTEWAKLTGGMGMLGVSDQQKERLAQDLGIEVGPKGVSSALHDYFEAKLKPAKERVRIANAKARVGKLYQNPREYGMTKRDLPKEMPADGMVHSVDAQQDHRTGAFVARKKGDVIDDRVILAASPVQLLRDPELGVLGRRQWVLTAPASVEQIALSKAPDAIHRWERNAQPFDDYNVGGYRSEEGKREAEAWVARYRSEPLAAHYAEQTGMSPDTPAGVIADKLEEMGQTEAAELLRRGGKRGKKTSR